MASVQYANAWEASLKQHPCCSPSCVAKFNPDVHWLPSEPPVLLSDENATKMVTHGKSRLKSGDSPGIVACDLLTAGVPSWMVRRAMFGTAAAAASSDKAMGGWNLWGIFSWFFFGVGLFFRERNRGLADPKEVIDGTDRIDEWERHFSVPNTSGGEG